MNKNLEEKRNRTLGVGINKERRIRAPKVDKTAISPYDRYCDGYGMPGAYGNGYVSVLTVSVGTVKKTDDFLLDGIVSYDRAEINDAYVGQINMLTASSFCGIAGQVWGHDLAVHDSIAKDEIKPLFEVEQFDGTPLKVFDAKPLLEAGIELFGTEKERRFTTAPGAHVICANKSVTSFRPKEDRPLKDGEAYGVWSFIAISLSNDRDHCADLFIEDAGLWTKNDNEEDLKKFLEEHRKSVVWSVEECGRDSHVLFERTYVGFAYTIMKPGEIGNALTCAPYVTLARDAVPETGFGSLNYTTLPEWLEEMEFKPLTKCNEK
ncbi:histidine decarboxylase, pyruvoyl type [Clostridium sp. LY3-2]|uniref:histidine decarboxylase, pyruvoyl type n=1 Tax=Clostridium sp. LY3-2 TaxID=2942482 RepID=UPI00215210B9|nr:histidine decarboxylase, pyruvoyl type [Clostridium sp. LY3-2]MCR6514014.1 histidine decarboxylase, pyruvoyl type [Clostridium sp. LY3-2]